MRLRPLRLRSSQWQFVAQFIREHARLVTLLGLALAGTIVAEISIPLFAHLWESSIIRTFDNRVFLVGLPLALIRLGVYILLVGSEQYIEQRLLRSFFNTLRRIHIQNALARPQLEAADGIGRLIAKVTYHLSLLEAGIRQAFFGACRWLLTSLGLIAVSFFVDPWLLLVCLASVPLDIGVMLLTHVVAKRYVSREQTLSSRIIRETVALAANHQLLRRLGTAEQSLQDLERLMELDAFFRIRRSMWIKSSQAIVFAIVLLGAMTWVAVQIRYGIGFASAVSSLVVFGVVSALLLKKLFLSTRIGLFFFPLALGAAISLPLETSQAAPQTYEPLRTLSLRSRKPRLVKGVARHRNLQFDLRAGETLEISGTAGSGRSTLAAIFAGVAPAGIGRSWSLRVNGTYYPYADWRPRADTWLLDPLFTAHVSLQEWFASACGRRLPVAGRTETILQTLSQHEELHFVLEHVGGLSARYDDASFSLVQRGLLQLARCFVTPPSLLIVDHLWFDLGDKRFLTLLQKVQRACPDMIVVCFTKGNDSTISYDQRVAL